jgi:asparagine synthase (glutamine-hydrolysing)
MCGILGISSRHPVDDPSILVSMRDAMNHRGPDDAGLWWSADRCVGLAHRRLAILDLTAAGHQPMCGDGSRHVITFNGEIYNHETLREELRGRGHAFRSRSDTEVILAAYKEWGSDCLNRLDGQFALAIYDQATRELFLGRDRAGEKPLFYSLDPDRFLFASELKALMADPRFPRTLNIDALDHYLAYGYVPGETSILRGVRKLLPGHAMVYRRDTHEVRSWRYWELPVNRPDPSATAEDLVRELQQLLEGSVRRQLVADVPVGVLLSGGLDSSLVTAMAAKVGGRRIKTFTVAFPGHGSLDEGPYARLVADHFGTEHHELVAEPASVSMLPALARQWDEPLADHSIVPSAMLSKLVRSSVTVALGGDGGDELFGGYPHYNFLSALARVKRFVPRPLRKAGAATASRLLPVGTRFRNHIIGLEGNLSESIAAVNMFFDKAARQRLLAPLYRAGYEPQVAAESIRGRYVDHAASVYQNAAQTDFRTTMVDDYLVKTDRASMLHSLELRAPFLGRELIEFAFGRVPDRLKVSLTERKILLRALARQSLPAALDTKRKQGFSLPLRSWFKEEWGTFMETVLAEASPLIFDRAAIARVLNGQKKGLANTERIFALAMFELWRREYRVEL